MNTGFRGRAAVLLVAGAVFAQASTAQGAERISSRKDWTAAVQTALIAKKPTPEMLGGEAFRQVGGNLRTQVGFTIGPDGAVADIRVKRSSGVEAADAASLDMVRAAAPFPAFTPDMDRTPMRMDLPVRLMLPEPAGEPKTLYVDAAAGFQIKVAPPLSIVGPHVHPEYDILVQVAPVASGAPSFGKAGEPFCGVGFQKEKKNPLTQSELNAPTMVNIIADALEGSMQGLGLELMNRDVSDYRGAKLIELRAKPRAGSKAPDLETYIASFDRPGGGVVVTCAAAANEMGVAMDTFRAVRDGAEVIAQ